MEEPTSSLAPGTAAHPPVSDVGESPPTCAPTRISLPGENSPISVSHILGYEILSELGRGGMGVVYKARQIGLGRTVALKVLLHAAHAGTEALARFRNEAKAIARLQHANIVAVYEIGDTGELPYFSMEYCEAGSLAHRLTMGPMDSREAAELVRALALAMQAAHDQQVIHRDLKPANILISCDGTPKVADFGLARRTDEAGQTASGVVLGTPSYMAPEQARGKVRELGPRTDVYALGAILYECLTGKPPFLKETSVDTLMAVVSEPLTPPRQLRPELPVALETICFQCMEKDPAKRPADAQAVALDLEAFLLGRSVLGLVVAPQHRASTPTPNSESTRIVLAAVITIGALFTMMVVGLVILIALNNSTTTEGADAPKQESSTKAEPKTEFVAEKQARPPDPLPVDNRPWGPGVYMRQATLRVMASVQTLSDRYEKLGYNDNVCFLGAYLSPEKSVSFTLTLNANTLYGFLGGGDADAEDVDIEVRNARNEVIQKDTRVDASPVVVFKPSLTATYTVTLILAKAEKGSFCTMAIVCDPGWKVPPNIWKEATERLILRCSQYGKRNGLFFLQENNQWALFGAMVRTGSHFQVNQLRFGAGSRVAVAAGDSTVSKIDLYILDNADDAVKKDEDDDPDKFVHFRSFLQTGYKLRVRNARSSAAGSMLMAALLQEQD